MRSKFLLLCLVICCLGTLAHAAAPTITSFSPASGPIGTVVTVTGTNLATAPTAKVNGKAATVQVTTIKLTIAAGTTTGKITVTTPGGTATSATDFTVILAPTVTSFTPTSGAIGRVVTIAGANFTGASAVKFNGTAATTFAVVSANSITATVPAGATTGKISVTTPGGTATSTANFTVIPAPTITSFTPTSGPIGTVVTISGTNFTGASAVKINATAATSFTLVSATSIKVTVPAGATTGKISVTTPGGTATSATNFTVIPAPTISSFTPASGGVGTIVTLTGTNFTGASAVKINATAATSFTVVSATSIKVTVPAGATSGKISVTTPGGTATSAANFTVIRFPTITSFTQSGRVGATITIIGTNLTGASAVKFNGVASTSITYITATSLKATVPAAATTGKITVTTPEGNATSATNFTVIPSLPTISSFMPSSGSVGSIVTVTGTNLTGASTVKFNGTASTTITNITATSLEVTVPASATTGKISVTTPGGTATSAANFTVTGGTPGINPTDNASMDWVPGGTFTMGTLYDPWWSWPYTQQVTLSGFWMYKYEVTVAQYRAFCAATNRALPDWPGNYYSWAGKSGWGDASLQQHPIVNVDWYDAKAYADWAGVRLPTEAQWEYAARGVQGRNYPWGGTATANDPYNGWDQTKCANYYNSYVVGKSTWPVGSFPSGASWCGARDMAGNVWEWCADWYDDYSTTPVTNPTGPSSGDYRVLRGGSWGIYEGYCRSAYRNYYDPYFLWGNYGFRCVSPSPGP